MVKFHYLSFLAAALVSAATLGCAVTAYSDDDAAGFYPGDGSGADLSKNHRDLTVDPSVTFETGQVGQAFKFSGTGQPLHFPSGVLANSFATAFWMKDAGTQVNGAIVIGQYNTSTSGYYWDLSYTTDNGGQYAVETAQGNRAVRFKVTTGAWHYVVINRDDNGVTRVFVDGLFQGSSYPVGTDDYSGDDGVYAGAGSGATHPWKGSLDEVRFYDRALADTEAMQIAVRGRDQSIPGTANIYLAGQVDGVMLGGDSTPANRPVSFDVTAGQTMAITAVGAVGPDGSTAITGAEGDSSVTTAAANHLSSYAGPRGALVGVYLDASGPAGSTPAGPDYTSNGTDDLYATHNSPPLRQVFYIGNGLADSGGKVFTAPAGATKLWVGVIDNGDSDNTGSFMVHVTDPAAVVDRYVAGQSNIYGADASEPVQTGFMPPSVHFTAGTGQMLSVVSANGVVSIDPTNDNAAGQADGSPNDGITNVASLNNISGVKLPTTGALVGLFLAEESAPSTAPAKLDFTSAGLGTNFTTLSPVVGQVFFIGDGATSDGSVQRFNVPATATSLYVGLADGSATGGAPGGYNDNQGAFEAIFQITGGGTGGASNSPLTIAATDVTDSDPTGKTAHLGDKITYHFHWDYSADATGQAKNLKVSIQIPTYIENATDLVKQFADADLTYNHTFGTYVKATSAKNKDAKLVISVSDLDPGFGQDVEFSINLSNKLRPAQQIALPNNYGVASTSSQPATGTTGFDSHAANVSVDVRANLSFTVTPDKTTVAPGGYVNYTLKVTNNSPAPAPNSWAVLRVPDNMRFAGFGFNKKGVLLASPADANDGFLVSHSLNDNEVLVDFGTIAAGKSDSETVTLQAKWVDPVNVTDGKLTLFDYAAGFLDKPTGATFTKADKGSTTASYFDVLKDPTHSTGVNVGGAGPVQTNISGSTAQKPVLAITRGIVNTGTPGDDVTTQTSDTDSAENLTQPGKIISMAILIGNTGPSPAEDVQIDDFLPTGTNLVTSDQTPDDITATSSPNLLKLAVQLVASGKNKTLSDPILQLESDQRTLHIRGLHLDPNSTITAVYHVRVQSTGDAAPAVGDEIHFGSATVQSGSVTTEAFAFPSDLPVRVTGQTTFAYSNMLTFPPRPTVSYDLNATVTQLNALYKKSPDAYPVAAAPLAGQPAQFISGATRFYIRYANTGTAAANGVTLAVPLPANTVFYRATGVTNGKVAALPINTTVQKPDAQQPGTVTFKFPRLNAGAQGEVMVEVIALPSAINSQASQLALHDVEIYDNTAPHITQAVVTNLANPGAHSAKATLTTIPLADAQHVPQLGIMVDRPSVAQAGQIFNVEVVIFNHGAISAPNPLIEWQVPTGTTLVSFTYGSHVTTYDNVPAGTLYTSAVSQNSSDFNSTDNPAHLDPHTAAGFSIQLRANNGSSVQAIGPMNINLVCSYVGRIYPYDSPLAATLAVPASSPSYATAASAGHFTVVQNADFVGLPNGGVVIPLGGGQLVAAGGGNLVAAGGGNLVAAGGGNLVAAGGGNVINVGSSSAGSLLSGSSSLVAAGGGNIFNSGTGNLISQDGAGLISNDGAGLISTVSNLVAAGGGNLVAAGGGNLVAAGGGNLVAAGGGNLVAAGGGNLVAAGGGNLVAAGGGNILSFGGSMINNVGLVAAGGGNLVAAGGGNLVAAGGGNLVAAGGGNVVSLANSSALNPLANGGGIIGGGGGRALGN